MERLGRLAQELETAAAANDSKRISELVPLVSEENRRATRELGALLQSEQNIAIKQSS